MSKSLGTRMQGEAAEVTTTSPYAHTHQFGSRKRRIPKRQFVGVSKDVRSALSGILDAEFERAFARG